MALSDQINLTQFVHEKRSWLLFNDYVKVNRRVTRQANILGKRLALTKYRGRWKHYKLTDKFKHSTTANIDIIRLLLLLSERARFNVLHVKELNSRGHGKRAEITGSLRKYILRRLSRALQISRSITHSIRRLRDESKATDTDYLEAIAYESMLRGEVQIERCSLAQSKLNLSTSHGDNWLPTVRNFSVARIIYASLYHITKADVFRDFINDTVDPCLSYAYYRLVGHRNVRMSSLAVKYFPRETPKRLISTLNRVDASILSENSDELESQDIRPVVIHWRDRHAKISDPEICQCVNAIDKQVQLLNENYAIIAGKVPRTKLAEVYDRVLTTVQEAVSAINRVIEEREREKVNETDPLLQNLYLASLWANYELIGWRVGRDRVLLGLNDGLDNSFTLLDGNVKPKRTTAKNCPELLNINLPRKRFYAIRERGALYVTILRSISSIQECRGAMSNDKFCDEVNTLLVYFRALKCLNLAYYHNLTNEPDSITRVLALLERVQNLVEGIDNGSECIKEHDRSELRPLKLDICAKQMESLRRVTYRLTLQNRVINDIDNMRHKRQKSAAKPSEPLIEQLWNDLEWQNNQAENTVDLVDKFNNLVIWPPRLRAIMLSPLFLDIAWNDVKYPSEEDVKNLKDRIAKGITNSTKLKDDELGNVPDQEDDKKPRRSKWFGIF